MDSNLHINDKFSLVSINLKWLSIPRLPWLSGLGTMAFLSSIRWHVVLSTGPWHPSFPLQRLNCPFRVSQVSVYPSHSSGCVRPVPSPDREGDGFCWAVRWLLLTCSTMWQTWEPSVRRFGQASVFSQPGSTGVQHPHHYPNTILTTVFLPGRCSSNSLLLQPASSDHLQQKQQRSECLHNKDPNFLT